MASISITTTQNVTIDYQLAVFRQRVFAFLIDLLIITSWSLIHLFIGFVILGGTGLSQIYSWLLIVPFASFYTLFMEYYLNGQTPGKRSMNIRVVMINGKEPSFIDYFIRWSLRFIEIYFSSGVIASIMISTTNLKQRLADIVAGTVLVSVNLQQSVTADDLLKIGAMGNYTPSYPGVIIFSESDMLKIKRLVDRFFSFNNEAHRLLILDTAQGIANKMGVKIKEPKPELFLKTLIRDYVVLTR